MFGIDPIRSHLGLASSHVMNRIRSSLLMGLIAVVLVTTETGCRAIGRFGESRQTIASRRLSRQGLKAMHEGEWSVAETLFKDALEVSNSDDRAHFGLAESMWQRGEREAAISHMEQAVRLSAGDPKLAERLGRMYLDVGRLEESIQQSNLAMQAERTSADAWSLHGDCLHAKGDLEAALAAYHRALAIQPDYASVQLKAAEVYLAQGRFDRIVATLDRLQEGADGATTPARADLLRGIAMQQLGRPVEAQRSFAVAASKNPTDAAPHLQLASLLLEHGDVQEAKLSLAHAAQLEPDSAMGQSLKVQIDAVERSRSRTPAILSSSILRH